MSSVGLDVSNIGEFVPRFISNCLKSGKDPIEVAKSEIDEIDIKLTEAERLRILRYNLTHVLESMGDMSYLSAKKRLSSSPAPKEEIKQQIKEENKEIRNLILQSLSNKDFQTVRTLINSCNMFGKDAEVIRAIEDLKNDGKITRLPDSRIKLVES